MNRLIIIGAGGFGREVYAWSLAVASSESSSLRVAGFLDSDPDVSGGTLCSAPIFGDPLTYIPMPGDRFICAIGDPVNKLRLCRLLKERGAQFITLVHPTAIVGPRCSIGEGSVLCPYSILTTDVSIGDYVTINCHSSAGHDTTIGEGSTLSAHCDITGHAVLGEGVFLGSHASILPGVKVGDYARIGAGSVVLRNVQPFTTVMGVPAKKIFERRPTLLADERQSECTL